MIHHRRAQKAGNLFTWITPIDHVEAVWHWFPFFMMVCGGHHAWAPKPPQ
jgi:hypothetical protein